MRPGVYGRAALSRPGAGGGRPPRADPGPRGVGNLRPPAEAAVTRVEIRLQAAQGRGYRFGRQLRVMRRRAGMHVLESRENRLVLAADLLAVLAVDLRDALEKLGKSRQVVARLLGEIS